MRNRGEQPIGRGHYGNRIAPGVAAALIRLRRAAGVVVRAICGEFRYRAVGMRMTFRRVLVRMTGLLRIRRMMVSLHRRLRMARPGAACEGERDGQSKNEGTAEPHGVTINAAGAYGQTLQKKTPATMSRVCKFSL
jgi:hypothetical protein